MNYDTPNGRAIRSTRQILADRGLSIEWLSATTGIALRTLKRRLLGETAFTLDEAWAISLALGVRMEELTAAPSRTAAAA